MYIFLFCYCKTLSIQINISRSNNNNFNLYLLTNCNIMSTIKSNNTSPITLAFLLPRELIIVRSVEHAIYNPIQSPLRLMFAICLYMYIYIYIYIYIYYGGGVKICIIV